MRRNVIAVTGYIGSGKSSVMAILRQMGYATADCDVIARQVADDPQVVRQVAELLGEQYAPCGKLDRAAIRSRVFDDPDLLAAYQSLFFGRVRERLVQIAAQAQGALFVEIAVPDAFDFPWDGVWRVESDRDKLISRVCSRDGVPDSNVQAILSRQQQRIAATCTIVNSGSLSDLERSVKMALADCGL